MPAPTNPLGRTGRSRSTGGQKRDPQRNQDASAQHQSLHGSHLDTASAAFKVGDESPSQFSRECSRMFGAPPKRDIAGLRQQAHTTAASR